MATLQEIEEYWSTSDIFDAIDYLDFVEDVEAHNQAVAAGKANNKG